MSVQKYTFVVIDCQTLEPVTFEISHRMRIPMLSLFTGTSFQLPPSSKHLLFKQKRITIQSEGPSVAFAFSSTHPDIVRAELRPEIVPSICRSRNPNVIEFSRTSSQKTNDVSFHHLDFEAF